MVIFYNSGMKSIPYEGSALSCVPILDGTSSYAINAWFGGREFELVSLDDYKTAVNKFGDMKEAYEKGVKSYYL
jgi:hypothetical protein